MKRFETKEKYYLIHPEDCTIEQPNDHVINLFDGDTELIWTFKAPCSREQILSILAFVNKAYSIGIRTGKYMVAAKINKALEIGE